MPQNQTDQTSQSSAQANEDNVNAFMSLDEAGQTRALAKMSPDAKQWLLTGVKARKSQRTQPGQTEQKEDQGILSGAVQNVVSTAKGIKGLFAPESEDNPPTGKEVIETYAEGGRQAKQQFKQGIGAARAGDPVGAAARFGQSAVTGAALLDPLATGSVVSANRATDEGRYRESIGSGLVDLLMLWGGKKVGSAPDNAVKLNKIVSGTGVEMADVERVLPEIEEASKKSGRAKTIGDFKEIIDNGASDAEKEFRRDFDPIKSRRAYTPAIKNHIDRIIRENPNLAQTPEGMEELAALRRVQREYDRPFTLENMNLERSRLRKQMRGLYNAAPSDAAAKIKLDAELRAKKIVADSFSETVNDHLAHEYKKPQSYYDILRQKQEAFINMQDHMAKEVERLRNKQAAEAGKGITEKLKPHAYASGAGPRVHIPFSEAVSEGPGELADSKVKSAFQRGGPQQAKKAAKAAILSLPLSHLTTAGEDARKSRVAPPPQLDDQ
jgi:hypothetical protein